ncbi:FeoA family protein [Arcanobacterium hippocoleae]
MNLLEAEIGRTYQIREIETLDEELNAFLLRLGAYPGEPITVISKKRKSCIVLLKNSRYGLDFALSQAVII